MKRYSLDDFAKVASTKTFIKNDIELSTLPSVEEVKTLADWTAEMLDLFEVTADEATKPAREGEEKGFDRSGALQRMAYLGAEQQWTNEQILATLLHLDDRWGKYTKRRDRLGRYLIPMIDRARSKVGYDGLDFDLSNFLGSKKTEEGKIDDTKLIYGFSEFVEADFPIDWTLDGLLAQGGIGIVTGYPGTGKTQFCIQLGAYLATGAEKFLKWENAGGKKRKVLFLSLEMSEAPLNHFMSQIARAYDDRETLNRNFLVAPLGVSLPLDQKQGQAFLNNLLETHMPDVVVIDSLQRVVSKELSDELAVKGLFHYLALARKKYGCAMVMVHHNRKQSAEAKKKAETTLDDMYGSRFISADVDFIMSLHNDTPSSNVLTTTMLKNRLARTLEPFEMVRDENLTFSLDFEDLRARFTGQEGADGVSLGV